MDEGKLQEEKNDNSGDDAANITNIVHSDYDEYHALDPNFAKNAFPNHLGCFGIIQTSFTSDKSWPLKADKPFYWKVTKNRKDTSVLASFLRFVESQNADDFQEKLPTISLSGAWSPPHRVNLDAKSRKLANIPLSATKFAWFYPAKEIPIDVLEKHPNKNVQNKWKKSASVMSLIIGGYSYFNDNNQLLIENTLVPGAKQGLNFGAPKKWKHQFAEKLIEQERFHCITFSHMLATGAMYFAWIFPFEELFDDNGNSWVVSDYGAFAYLWHEPGETTKNDKWKFDRYFEVEAAPTKKSKKPKKPKSGKNTTNAADANTGNDGSTGHGGNNVDNVISSNDNDDNDDNDDDFVNVDDANVNDNPNANDPNQNDPNPTDDDLVAQPVAQD